MSNVNSRWFVIIIAANVIGGMIIWWLTRQIDKVKESPNSRQAELDAITSM